MPTVVIEPTTDILNKVSGQYDCLEYSFQNQDVVLFPQVKDLTQIFVNTEEIPFADGLIISNNDPLLTDDLTIIRSGGAVLDGYTFIEPNGSALDRANMVVDALKANPYLNSRYDIAVFGNPGPTDSPIEIRIEAKEPGSEFTISTEFISGPGPYTWMDVNTLFGGSAESIQPGFSYVIQLWEFLGVSQENFLIEYLLPGVYNSVFESMDAKFDLAKVVDLYLTHHLPDIAQSNVVKVEGLAGRYFLKHGIGYEVNGKFKPFSLQTLANVKAFKGTSRRLTGVDTSLFATGATGQKFITSMPVDGQIVFTCAACLWLYFYIPEGVTNIDIITQIDTQSGVIGPTTRYNISAGITEGIYSVPAGPGNLGIPDLQNPGVLSYEIWASVTDGSGVWETERASFQVDVTCKNNVQFFYRNQCGTIDTIEFQLQTQGALNYAQAEHCEFVECGDPIAENGIQVTRATSYESFQAVSQIHSQYETEEYIKDFYRSTWKGTKVNGNLVTIIPLLNQYAISRDRDLNLTSIFDYRYNFEEQQ